MLAEFGVVFLVFTLGLEFSLPRMVAMRREALLVGGGQVVLTTATFAAVLWAFDVQPLVAIIIGGALAMSSTAIVIRQLGEQGELNRTHSRIAVGILLFQDLAFVPLLALESALAGSAETLDALAIAGAILQGRDRAGAGADLPALDRASVVPRDRPGAQHRPVHARHAARFARRRVGDARSRPVDGAGCVPRRHAAGGNRVPSSARDGDPAVSRRAARPVLHHDRHAARSAAAVSRSCGWCWRWWSRCRSPRQ